MDVAGKTIIVTGAASGIGRALGLECLRRGASVALADMNEEGVSETLRLAGELANGSLRVTAHKLDVSNLEAWRSFRDEVLAEHEHVDGIINNAGISFSGSVEDMGYDHLESVMSVNFMGMVYGTKEFLTEFKQRPEAVVANVSSVFGLFPMKNQSAYCASKFTIRGFTEVLEQELKSTEITVCSIHPGHIGTNIVRNANEQGNVVGGVGADMTEEQKEQFLKAFEVFGLAPEKAAVIILDGISKKQRRIMVGKDAVHAERMTRLAPAWFSDKTNQAAM